jgi:GNAT superfamily N-acetyltransferase
MYHEIAQVALRTGERVIAARVRGPDADWAPRIEKLLEHKGEPWNWQNRALLRGETGLDASFFLLHRAGRPFAHVMIAACGGVGLLAHVWTEPADRGAGASSLLLDAALREFREQGGKALFLGTDPGSLAWHCYRRRGFVPLEVDSGTMAWHRASPTEFDRDWFDAAEAAAEPLAWPHWPASAPLFLVAGGGAARLVGSPLFGRSLPEGPLLPLLRAQSVREPSAPPAAVVLRSRGSAAVLGFACRSPHPLWPETEILDVSCHPRWWQCAPDMLAALRVPPASDVRTLAFCDELQREKRALFVAAGFRELARLPGWLRRGVRDSRRVDVSMLLSA